jgi:hypothetical protein
MYVLTIYQDAENNRAHFSSINAFTSMNSPSLSFAITAANQINRKILFNLEILYVLIFRRTFRYC